MRLKAISKFSAHRSTLLRAVGAVAAAAMWAASTIAAACVEGDVRGEAVTVHQEAGATAAGETAAMRVLGAGWFRAAEIVKQGGSSDKTSVTIELDGEAVITTSFSTLKNQWNQLGTSFIVAKVTTVGDTSTMTIWYSPELKFRGILALRVDVEEDGVESVRMRAVLNKPAPHEHVPGQVGTLILPAFR
jgi:hypothetical protein